VSSEPEPQVAWKAIEPDAQVFSRDGHALGTVAEVVGDYDADVFTGLAVAKGLLGRPKFVPAERVLGIWPSRIEVDVTPDEFDALSEHEAPPVIRVDPSEPRGFFDRLFGR
jgi:uncharacterized protein YrrD